MKYLSFIRKMGAQWKFDGFLGHAWYRPVPLVLEVRDPELGLFNLMY